MCKDSESVEFTRIYNTIFPTLIRIAYHMTGSMTISEDICQEAFIKLYQRNKSFPDKDQAKYWLIRVVKNLIFNYEKRKTRERKAYQRVLQQPRRIEPSGETEVLKKEKLSIIQNSLQKLPYKLRSVIILKEYGRMNYREIAKILGISEGNVKVRVHRAREMLSVLIKENDYVS